MENTQQDLAWLEGLKIPEGLRSSDYEYEADRKALQAFQSVPGISTLCAKFTAFFLEADKADLLGRAVRVSDKQFPEINRLRLKAAEVLGVTPPPLFIVEAPVLNAFALGPDAENSFIIATRALVAEARPRELMFALGHEMGHVKSQHSLYITVAVLLSNTGMLAAHTLALPGVRQLLAVLRPLAEVALNAWARRAEVTCDRAGLLCCQDLEAGQRALLLLACGSRALAERIDLKEYETQREELARSVGKWRQLFDTHPHLPKRIRALELFAASRPYGGALGAAAGGPTLPELDLEVAKVLDDLEGLKGAAGSIAGWGKKQLGGGLEALAKGLAAASESLRGAPPAPEPPRRKRKSPRKDSPGA